MAFTCPVCWWTSQHPEDEKHGYCGNCHAWTGLSAAPYLADEELEILAGRPSAATT